VENEVIFSINKIEEWQLGSFQITINGKISLSKNYGFG
jgi:hypothetical protein